MKGKKCFRSSSTMLVYISAIRWYFKRIIRKKVEFEIELWKIEKNMLPMVEESEFKKMIV